MRSKPRSKLAVDIALVAGYTSLMGFLAWSAINLLRYMENLAAIP